MTRSAAPATSALPPPVTETSTPSAAAARARPATSPATSTARSASREPSRTRWPAAASRTASPRPCGPVPPSTPTTSSSTARSSAMRPIMPGRLLALPGAVLLRQLLLALGDRLHRVLGLLPRRVRPQPVPLGAAVAGLDGVVLQAVEPRPLRHRWSPLDAVARMGDILHDGGEVVGPPQTAGGTASCRP